MNTKTFTVSLLAATALAGPLGTRGGVGHHSGSDSAYDDFCAKNNKSGMGSVQDYEERAQIFHNHQNEINEHNRGMGNSDPNGLKLKMNWTGDLTPEEYDQLINLDNAAAEAKAASLDDPDQGLGLRMETATNVDHFADGFMHPVKNQGSCGSCWTFSANTTLEGTLAKKQNTSPVRISEQQIVDCTLTTNPQNEIDFGKDYGAWGCSGGWMDYSWNFHKDQGYMYDSDYRYTARNEDCKHEPSKTKGNVTSYGQIRGTIQDMKDKAMEQPLAVALNASSSAFRFYSSGVVRESDNCGSRLNHAVVVVGYSDGSDDGPSPGPSPTPTPEQDCKVTKWWHTCEDREIDDRRRMQSSNQNYWKVQNSWGTGWGDDGFILIEIVGGDGVCGINKVVQWVEGTTDSAEEPTEYTCWANGQENEAFCESGAFMDEESCNSNGDRCNWDIVEPTEGACWANGQENEAFCESGAFMDEESCNSNEPRCHWDTDEEPTGYTCWANGQENEAFCESGAFINEESCNSNGDRCHWDIEEPTEYACWAIGQENEAFCESGAFMDEQSCNSNEGRCHWDI